MDDIALFNLHEEQIDAVRQAQVDKQSNGRKRYTCHMCDNDTKHKCRKCKQPVCEGHAWKRRFGWICEMCWDGD